MIADLLTRVGHSWRPLFATHIAFSALVVALFTPLIALIGRLALNSGASHHQFAGHKKSRSLSGTAFSKLRAWRCPTLTWGDPTLPSALSIFTSEFEMGSGGSYSLLPPGKLVSENGEAAFPTIYYCF